VYLMVWEYSQQSSKPFWWSRSSSTSSCKHKEG